MIFHQFQRYKISQIIVNSIRSNNQVFEILEVGANNHKNLEHFLPNDNITYSDKNIPDELKHCSNYVECDATAMSIFENNSFDIVIALDVLEHIPVNKRKNFLSEINRVSKLGFLLSAPFSNKGIDEIEERVSTYYKTLCQEDIAWVKEHKINGLPNLTECIDFLKKELMLSPWILQHGSILIWEKLLRMELTTGLFSELISYWNLINDYYKKELFISEFDENGIKTFILSFNDQIMIEKIEKAILKLKKNLKQENIIKFMDLENSFYNLAFKVNLTNNYQDDTFIQLFINHGDGYFEKNSIIHYLHMGKQTLYLLHCFDISSFRNIKSLRIDLLNKKCIVIVHSIEITYINNFVDKIENFTSNAELYFKNKFIFLNNDPQLIIKNIRDVDIKYLTLNIEYINGNDLLIEFWGEQRNSNSNIFNILKENLITYEKDKVELNNRIELLNKQMKEITQIMSQEVLMKSKHIMFLEKELDFYSNSFFSKFKKILKKILK